MRLLGIDWHERVFCHPETRMPAGNVGDAVCSPLLYFPFPSADVSRLDVEREGLMESLRPDVVIYGGGSWPKRLRRAVKRFPNAINIAWGVGWTRRGKHGRMNRAVHSKLSRLFDIYAHRDWGCDGDYVPCASCMSPLFDSLLSTSPTHDVVFYGHPTDLPSINRDRTPTLHNDHMSLENVLNFLASGDTVITGSYHGVYWATLLGRKVIAIPYSKKFWHFKYPPTIVEDWREGIGRARSYDAAEVLEECRDLNRGMYNRVQGLIT